MEDNEIKFEFTGVLKEERADTYRKLPERSTVNSAGYDFYNPETTIINPHEMVYVKTGIKAKFPSNLALLLLNRSSNPKRKGLVVVNGLGLVDADYYNNPDNDGETAFAFMNITDKPVTIASGEKLGQGMFVEYFKTTDDNATGERVGGFGSTGN